MQPPDHAITPQDFVAFPAGAPARGFDEVRVREWAPGVVTTTHEHAFEIDARRVCCEAWLAVGGQTRHLQAGDALTLARGVGAC